MSGEGDAPASGEGGVPPSGDAAPAPPLAPAPRPESAPPPGPAPGLAATSGFVILIGVNAIGLDRVLALVLAPRLVRAFQVSVVYAGRVIHERPVLGVEGARVLSYAFLGQEALADLGHLAVAVLAFFYLRRSMPRPFALDRATALRMAKVGGVLASVFAVVALAAGLAAARVDGGAHLRTFLDRLDVPLLTDPVGRLLSLVGFLFTAPFAEEIVFRGLLYRLLRRRLRAPLATVIQATLFAACHLDTGLDAPLIAIPYLWGIAAAVLLERTGSLGAAVLLHAFGNACGLVAVAVVMGYPAEIYSALGGR